MIKKYIYGNPFPTEAVVENIAVADGEIQFFDTTNKGEFGFKLAEEDMVFGLGEQIRGINKRGWKYNNWNFDNPHHHEDTHSLYGAHNFIVVKGEETFGAFFDFAGNVTFDIGYTRRDLMTITPATMDLVVYIITGSSIKDIVNQFRKMIGRSYIPPMWALGYGQSRWGYKDEKDIREVAAKYKSAGIPIDSIYMDIDYMENYKDFTVSEERFPDLSKLSKDMKAEGIHLVPIIDAGVKIEADYDVYEEGVAKDFFCKDAAGNDFVGAVWPGKVHFPDFLNPKAREWFGAKYKALTDCGIDGFWNDMNEPAIFYTEDRLEEALDKIEEVRGQNIGIREYFGITGMIGSLSNHPGDYDKFFHNVNGQMIKHSEVHNLFGMNMTRAANEALCKINPDRRTLFFSRSSYIGAHRYGGIWQGDNKSWWSHILQAMQQLPALNMAGFLFIGCDTGGFGCDTTEDLMLRWLQLSMFIPLFRNHSADGTRYQELYRFSNVEAAGEMIKIRYCLIPYLYSEFLKAAMNDTLMFSPLAFEFADDEDACQVDDQLLLGDELMIAPIYKQNAKGRYVYLPEQMMMVRMRKYDDYETEIMPKGHHYVKANLDEVVFFIRNGKAIPMGEPVNNTSELKVDTYKLDGDSLLGFEGATYSIYEDDGISTFDESRVSVRELTN